MSMVHSQPDGSRLSYASVPNEEPRWPSCVTETTTVDYFEIVRQRRLLMDHSPAKKAADSQGWKLSLPLQRPVSIMTGSQSQTLTSPVKNMRLESLVSKRLHQRDAEIDEDVFKSEDPVYLDVTTLRCSVRSRNTAVADNDCRRAHSDCQTLAQLQNSQNLNLKPMTITVEQVDQSKASLRPQAPSFPPSWASYSQGDSWRIPSGLHDASFATPYDGDISNVPSSDWELSDVSALREQQNKAKKDELLHPHNCTPCRFHCYSSKQLCDKGSDCEFCHLEHVSKRHEKKMKSMYNRRRQKVDARMV